MKKRILSLALVLVLIFSCSIGASALTFSDVPSNAWYFKQVDYVSKYAIMNGTSSNKFSPNSYVKREDVAVIFANIEIQKGFRADVNDSWAAHFTDNQNSSKYYYKAVNWAAAFGVVAGRSSHLYGVGQFTTREDFCMILYKYSMTAPDYRREPGKAPPAYNIKEFAGAGTRFSDSSQISSYAKAAVEKCAKGKIVTGDPNAKFRPKDYITRAEAACMIYNYMTLNKLL